MFFFFFKKVFSFFLFDMLECAVLFLLVAVVSGHLQPSSV